MEGRGGLTADVGRQMQGAFRASGDVSQPGVSLPGKCQFKTRSPLLLQTQKAPIPCGTGASS